ncbi:MAG: hypothetical protein R3C53_07765 [Pirellulaceae bacterium]
MSAFCPTSLPTSSWKNFLHRNLRLGKSRDVIMAAWLLLAIACGFLAYIARMHEVTHDAFHEMSLFREALIDGEIHKQDVFAYTPTVNPSVHHEWATGAVLYFVSVGTGLGVVGISLLKFLLVASLWLMLYRVARMRGAHPAIFALLSFVVFPVLWVGFATVRAQNFTLLFIAIQLWMQERDCRGHRLWVVGWLVMLVAWLNLHAGFVVGAGMIAFHTLERFGTAWWCKRTWMAGLQATWHLLLAAPVAVLVLRINPYGWEYIPYLVRAISMPRPLIREWQPLWQTYMPVMTVIVFAGSVALFAYAQRNTRLRRARGAAFLAICTYMALKHIRHGSIYAVVWIAYVPAWISHTRLGRNLIAMIDRDRSIAIRVSQGIVCATLLFATYHQFWMPTMPPRRLYSTACYPIAAVEYLQENNFSGNLLTPFHVGSYVSWEMYPDVKVSLDGRYEVAYQEQVLPEHNAFFGAEGDWWEFLERYPTDAVLVHIQAPVVEKFGILSDSAETPHPPLKEAWRVVYRDDSFVILAADHCRLPTVDRTGDALPDGAWEAFSRTHAHWNRRPNRVLANH